MDMPKVSGRCYGWYPRIGYSIVETFPRNGREVALLKLARRRWTRLGLPERG